MSSINDCPLNCDPLLNRFTVESSANFSSVSLSKKPAAHGSTSASNADSGLL